MSSNLPPDLTENSYGAPWNDIDGEFDIFIKVRVGVSVKGPLSKEQEMDNLLDAARSLAEFIKDHVESCDDSILDVEIKVVE